MQFVTLLFEQSFQPDCGAIKNRISEILSEEIDGISAADTDNVFLIFYKEHVVEYSEGSVPPQTVFMTHDGDNAIADYTDEIQQSWYFPEAAEVVERAKSSVAVTEMMARRLEPKLRLKLFHAAVQAAVEVCKPIALVFHHSCEVVPADAYLSACSEPPELRPGSINIRLFTIADSDEEMIMDSRGLEEIGLPDVQCHFKHIDPNDVSRVLFNTAAYIVENGPTIESGHTIGGRTPEEIWCCQYEESLIEPKRELIDINPGAGYAAGNRNT